MSTNNTPTLITIPDVSVPDVPDLSRGQLPGVDLSQERRANREINEIFSGGLEEGSDPITRQFDETPGGGFADPDTIRETTSDAIDAARNLGPDYLDELAIGGGALVILVAILWFARPFVAATS
jgi:hypothetical protein